MSCLLHGDGHLSHCAYSRLDTVPTRCEDPAALVNTIPAYQDIDLFGQAHITQMMLTAPPDATLLLLDADNRSVMRLIPRSLELLNQVYPMPGTALKPGPAGAMTVNPNRVLFLAIGDQVYFATTSRRSGLQPEETGDWKSMKLSYIRSTKALLQFLYEKRCRYLVFASWAPFGLVHIPVRQEKAGTASAAPGPERAGGRSERSGAVDRQQGAGHRL
jgi:hypothetical protein